MKRKLQTLYLDYINNFLTIGAFADYYCMSDEKAIRVVYLGRTIHNKFTA